MCFVCGKKFIWLLNKFHSFATYHLTVLIHVYLHVTAKYNYTKLWKLRAFFFPCARQSTSIIIIIVFFFESFGISTGTNSFMGPDVRWIQTLRTNHTQKKWVKWSSLCSCVLCHLFQLLLSRPLIHSARCLSFLSVYLKCYTRITMRLYHCCGCELVQNESHCSVITGFSPFLLPAGCPAPTMRAK